MHSDDDLVFFLGNLYLKSACNVNVRDTGLLGRSNGLSARPRYTEFDVGLGK